MTRAPHPSVNAIWQAYCRQNPEYNSEQIPESFYFCDNEKDANECAQLVVEGTKRATATSAWWFEKNQEALPEMGDIFIVTDWAGEAVAIIQTVKVEPVAYKDISPEFAATEGEGDGSLKYWKEVHWAYYSREMAPYEEAPSEDMIIICETFKKIWPDQA